jgi:hypothetical protein
MVLPVSEIEEPEGGDSVADLGANLLGGSGATVLGAAIGGLPGAAVGGALAAGMPFLASGVLAAYRRLQWRSAERMTESAAELAGLTPDDALNRVLADDRLADLAGRATLAASQTQIEAKLQGLARALANGLQDETRIDVELLVVTALLDLEVPHIALLDLMTTERMGPQHPFGVFSVTRIRGLSPELGRHAEPLLAVLERAHLVKRQELDLRKFRDELQRNDVTGRRGTHISAQEPSWRITPFGALVLTYLGRELSTPYDYPADWAAASTGNE